MKKYIIISALFLIACFSLYSQSINRQTVIKAAENYAGHFKNQAVTVKDVHTYCYAGTKDKHGLYQVNYNTGGYIVMPNSKDVRPVLMVGESGSLHPDSLIPPVKMFINWYAAQVELLLEKNDTVINENRQQWDNILQNSFEESQTTKSVTNPLLDQKGISWKQGFTPLAPDSCGQKSVAGCVTTAMGQIMKFWEHPVSGEGKRSYSFTLENGCGDPTSRNLSESFDEIAFIWELIPGSPTGNEYEQMLEYFAGVGAKMDYSHSSSSASSSDARYALVNYFRYNASTVKEKDDFDNWKQKLRNSLDAGRPVYYRGEGNPSKGGKGDKGKDAHAFVCDGYGYGGDDDLFHFNFGWGSSNPSSSWFSLDSIADPSHTIPFNYTLDQSAIFNIYPDCSFSVPSYKHVNENVTIDNNEAKGWQADHIKVGDGYTFHIENGGYCQMVAQEKIELKPGFHAKEGSYFQISFDYEYCGNKK